MKSPAIPVAIALAALLVLAAPRGWPEDWDGVGFVLSVRHFDMARFQPHAPGYPVWVFVAKAVALVLPSAMAAATAVSIASAVLLGVLVLASLRSTSPQAAWLGAAAALVTPLAWRAGTVVGTEGLALACAAFAAWGLSMQTARARAGAIVCGVAAGIGLGVRLSWAPLFLGLLVVALVRGARGARGARGWGALGFVGAVLSWLVPLVIVVSPRALVALYTTHLGGHATRWGGTALTDPHRASSLARDLFVDGFGAGDDPLGLALGLVLAVVSCRALFVWRQRGFPGVGQALAVLAYLVWIAVGQNLREEPRHVVPIVVAVAVAIACALATSRVWALVACAWLALLGVRTATDGLARRSIPPPPASLVLLTRATPGAMAFGARSARFFDLHPDDARLGRPAATLGDVSLGIGRVDPKPAVVFVTDELDGLDRSSYPLIEVLHPCRPPRLDRRRPCLTVYELRLPAHPR
ncbi:MAG: hypothetical protein JWM74_3213 [Myxococcaceae bacterium]|nr:hypothetical protein [Myxococcaceae bacterium]